MDWVHCNKCFYCPGQPPKREFVLTNCGHILCKYCERSTQVEHCKVCGQRCNTTTLSSQMIDEVRAYFEEAEPALTKLSKVLEFQKTHRLKLVEHLKSVWEKYQKLKFAYQKLDEDNRKLKKENEMYRKQLSEMPTPPPRHNSPMFSPSIQGSQSARMQRQADVRSHSPFFITPSRPVPVHSSQNYRVLNTPSTPSDDGASPASVISQESYRSAASGRSSGPQRMYRPGLTPPLNSLSLLSLSREDARNSSTRI